MNQSIMAQLAAELDAQLALAAQFDEAPQPEQPPAEEPPASPEQVISQELEAELPVPPRNFLESDQSTRYKGADWFEKIRRQKSVVIGAGGIGSWVVYFLARASIGMITVYDGDTVDTVNLAGQLYRTKDLGHFKVDALREIVMEYAPTLQGCFYSDFYVNEPLDKITIAALDSMRARRLVFDNWVAQTKGLPKEEKSKWLFVDGRMSANSFQVFVFRASQEDKIKMYDKKCLFDDSLADATACSFKATSHIGGGIGSYIMSLVQEHLHLEDDGMFETNIKFFNEFDTSFGTTLKQQKTWQYRKA